MNNPPSLTGFNTHMRRVVNIANPTEGVLVCRLFTNVTRGKDYVYINIMIMYIYIYICIRTHTHTRMYIYIHTHIYIYIHMHLYIYIYIRAYTYTTMHIYIYTHLCVCVSNFASTKCLTQAEVQSAVLDWTLKNSRFMSIRNPIRVAENQGLNQLEWNSCASTKSQFSAPFPENETRPAAARSSRQPSGWEYPELIWSAMGGIYLKK